MVSTTMVWVTQVLIDGSSRLVIYKMLPMVVPEETVYVFHTTVSLWKLSSSLSIQETGSSFPSVPPNLQANPLSRDISYISLSDWNGQFSEILENQIGFTGSTYAGNNYRDTIKDLTLGAEIVQHQAPMLKAMLLSSTEEFDLPDAIRFAELEYKKFKNKFLLKIVDISNRGVLSTGVADNVMEINNPSNWAAAPSQWVTTALNEIKANFNSSFPHALSTMAGGYYYIPPTPAFLGVMQPTTPQFVVDDTYSNQTLFIRGHDGSMTPAFGVLDSNGYSTDWRDYVLLALETLIYVNIPSIIAADPNSNIHYYNAIQSRLNFDVQSWMNGLFYQVPKLQRIFEG